MRQNPRSPHFVLDLIYLIRHKLPYMDILTFTFLILATLILSSLIVFLTKTIISYKLQTLIKPTELPIQGILEKVNELEVIVSNLSMQQYKRQ